MRRSQDTSPEWLERWLSLPFYTEKCDKHVHKYNTVFCAVCLGKAICETCWKDNSKDHKDHLMIQVCTASRRPAIEIEKIRNALDISFIQQYKVNNKDILYLSPNMGGAVGKKNNPKCEMCKRRLIQFKYKFCSISCKKETIERMEAECCPMRKRRKGSPQRAPLT